MLQVGLTGGIGSGKSTVSARLAALGAVVVDYDLLAREAVEPGTPALAAIVERFGREVVAADGTLDRPALGAVVLADEPTANVDSETAAMLLGTVIDALEDQDKTIGAVTLCIGGGMGIATILERV